MLEQNQTLEVLDFSGNHIKDLGATEIAKALKINTTLKKLDLSGNGIQGAGLADLCKSLEENEGLTDVNLWGNFFTDKSVMVDYSTLLNSSRGSTLKLDFSVHFTDQIPYLARAALVDTPVIWS